MFFETVLFISILCIVRIKIEVICISDVKVYSTPTCPWCFRVKDFLNEKGISFDDIDVNMDRRATNEMIEKSGQMGVPVVDVKGTIIVGFDPARIMEAVKTHRLIRGKKEH